MQGHPDSVLLGNWNHRLEEVFQVRPDPFLADLAPFGESLPFGVFVIEFADQRAATRGYVRLGSIPTEAGHPVVAEQRDTYLCHGLDAGNIILDLFVASRQTEFDLFRRYGMAFHSRERQPCALEVALDLLQRLHVAVSW